MILDYEYSKKRKEVTISYINKTGNKSLFKVQNIERFKSFVYDENGKYDTWDGKKASVSYVSEPGRFDLKRFILELPEEQKEQFLGRTFPKLYTFDIETEISDEFPDPQYASQPITTISIVSPEMKTVVLATKPMSTDDVSTVEELFKGYLDNNPFYKSHQSDFDPSFKYITYGSEKEMLSSFLKDFVAKIPVLAGWNSLGFDWYYIQTRIRTYYPDINFTSCSCNWTLKNRRHIPLNGPTFNLSMPRHTLLLDMMDVIDKEDYVVMPQKESLSLDYIATESTGTGKIEYTGDLQYLYETNYPKYVYYNAIDSVLVQLIARRFKVMDHIYMYGLNTYLDLDSCFSKIALTDALVFNYFHSIGVAVPFVDDYDSRERGALLGAYVRKPQPGKWRMLTCNDFSSLYPTGIITCNLSFENIVGHFWDEAKLEPYRNDPVRWIVVGPSVFKNIGTKDKPVYGEEIGVFLNEKALEPYRKDKNYFVSVNGTVYKNDKDYSFRIIQRNLKQIRNVDKYLAKNMDASIMADINHIMEGKNVVKHTYDKKIQEVMASYGFNIVSSEDIRNFDDISVLKRVVADEISYRSNNEQSMKYLGNSMYGGSSHKAFYWYRMDLAADITGEGRNLIHYMEKHFTTLWKENWLKMGDFHKKWGIEVDTEKAKKLFASDYDPIIYGDTDSLYMEYERLLGTIRGYEKFTLKDKLDIVLKINLDFLNEHNRQYMTEYFNGRHAQSAHDMELETIAKAGVWGNCKKKYAQIILWKDGKFYDMDELPLKSKGLELIKASTPKLARDILKDFTYFMIDSDGKYLSQELNIKAQNEKKNWMAAPIDSISGNLNVKQYSKYVISDDDPRGPKYALGTPASVKALALYNWLINVRGYKTEPIYGGKLRWYLVKTNRKNDTLRFAYPAGEYPKWADVNAPCDRSGMYKQWVLEPMNRLLDAMGFPSLTIDGSLQPKLFD